PAKFEKRDTITREQYLEIKNRLGGLFRDRIKKSQLSDGDNLTEDDLRLTIELIDAIGRIENAIIPEEKTRPWKPACVEHLKQVECVAETIADAIMVMNPKEKLDRNRIKIKALIHDIGRFASHDPLIHGLAGRKLLKELGFSRKFFTTAIAHLEAGVGPYVVGITPKTWPEISNDPPRLHALLSDLPTEEIIIALADMAKIGIEDPPGSGTFVNKIADPIEGVAVSAKRRPGEKSTMYLGFAKALKDFLERKHHITFGDEDGITAKVQKRYEKI
ncbi:MAG: HD domain-containing protein, partial [Patescibacteria group bacterium]